VLTLKALSPNYWVKMGDRVFTQGKLAADATIGKEASLYSRQARNTRYIFTLVRNNPEKLGIPKEGEFNLSEFMDKETIEKIVKRTRDGGIEIVNYLKTGSAYYAPSVATLVMMESILLDKKKILPCSVLLDGEYGVHQTFAGVPVKLGRRGVEQIIEVKLNDAERAAFMRSVEAVREGCAKFM